jgi:thymidylate synthase (FAD)
MQEVIFRSDMTVELVQSMGGDDAVVRSARVSTTSDTLSDFSMGQREEALINYLMRDRHGSPFEHNAFTFFVEAPIFVFREFMRHRIASYNEESGRYKELQPVFYVPDEDRKLVQVGKPGAYTFEEGSYTQKGTATSQIKRAAKESYDAYKRMLDAGIAREVARAALPVGIYSSMYVTMNARALMNFLSLRTTRDGTHFPSFPQREIEMVAEKMEEFFAQKMPITYRTFNENGRVAP